MTEFYRFFFFSEFNRSVQLVQVMSLYKYLKKINGNPEPVRHERVSTSNQDDATNQAPQAGTAPQDSTEDRQTARKNESSLRQKRKKSGMMTILHLGFSGQYMKLQIPSHQQSASFVMTHTALQMLFLQNLHVT